MIEGNTHGPGDVKASVGVGASSYAGVENAPGILKQYNLRIGITAMPDLANGLWASGIRQNIVYLALLLRRLAFTTPFYVMPDGDKLPHSIDGVPVLCASDAVVELDMLIEIGVRLDACLMSRFRARGGKLISYVAGNVMVMNFESVASGSSSGEIPAEAGFDAIWLTPQHMAMNASYCAMTRKGAVREAPHIWHPSCLSRAIDQFGANDFFWKRRDVVGAWKVGVFDPTVNVVKTFHLPLLVCEEAERRDSDLVARVLLFSARRFIGNFHFEELVAALDLGRRGKIFAEDRHAVPQVLGSHVEAVVTHQWQNNLNYLYWDVLYSGRPLIHNLPEIEAGYCYRDFDPADGGRVLADALAGHNDRRQQARSRELDVLWTYSIDNPAVQAAYASLIREAMEIAA